MDNIVVQMSQFIARSVDDPPGDQQSQLGRDRVIADQACNLVRAIPGAHRLINIRAQPVLRLSSRDFEVAREVADLIGVERGHARTLTSSPVAAGDPKSAGNRGVQR